MKKEIGEGYLPIGMSKVMKGKGCSLTTCYL